MLTIIRLIYALALKKAGEIGEMAQQVRALVTLPRDQGLTPCAHTTALHGLQ